MRRPSDQLRPVRPPARTRGPLARAARNQCRLACCVLLLVLPGLGRAQPTPDPLTAGERAWVRAHGPLRFAPDPAFPPFEFFDAAGRLSGVTPDILAALARNLGLEIKPVRFGTWTDVLEGMRRGEADLLGTLTRTPEREQFLAFTQPYLSVPVVLFVNQAAPHTRGFAELAGHRVGVVRNYGAHAWLSAQHPEVTIVPVVTTREGLLMLALGQLDAMLETLPVGQHVLAENSLSTVRLRPEVLFTIPQHLGVTRTNTPLLGILEKGLASVALAERERIFARWTGQDALRPRWALSHWVWELGGVAAAVLALVLLWNRSLRRLVDRRTEALRESEARARQIFDSLPVAAASIDAQGNAELVNRKFTEQFGYTREDLPTLDRWFERAFPEPAYRQRVIERWTRAVAQAGQSGRETDPLEASIVRGDGSVRRVEAAGRLVAGKILVTLNDLTDKKHAEALRDAQNRVLGMVARAEPLREVLTALCRFMDSASAEGRSSILVLDATGKRFAWGVAPALPEAYNRALEGFAAGPDRGSCGTAVYRKAPVVVTDISTDPLWAPWRDLALPHGLRACASYPVFGSQGQVLGAFALYYRRPVAPGPSDLHLIDLLADLAAVAIERTLAEATLRESQANLAAAQRIARLGSWEADISTSGKPVPASLKWSDQVFRIFGCEPGQLEVTNENFFRMVHPEDRPRIRAAVQQAIEQHTPYQFEHRIILPDGAERIVQEQAEILRDPATGQPVRLVGTVQDITERKRAEETRARLEADLRQAHKMEAVGQLAGGIAHDFNNILTVVLGHATVLAEEPQLPAALRAPAAQIVESARRAASLTRQLLAFSRRQVMQVAPLHLNEVLANISTMLQRLLGEHIALHCDFGASLPPVEADAGMLEQVIVNLAVNARDAMPKGGRLVIATGVEQLGPADALGRPEAREGRFVTLRVQDNGCGIDPATQARMFEPFFTTKEVGKGTGLGLATVYGVVKQHQGWIEVSSQVDQGSTFVVFLPACDVQPPPPPLGDAFAPAQGGHETILVVEDESALRNLVRICLRRAGYEVLEASNGLEALKVWEANQGRIDLLLTDLVMPEGISGHELAERLRAAKPGLKVIYSSGYSRDTLATEGASPANDFHLPKPYQPAALTQTVRRCLDTANS